MKENVLYRSSTPLRPDIGRNEYAMTAMEEEGIRSVINLEDSKEEMQSLSTYTGSYYSCCAIANPEMDYMITYANFYNVQPGDRTYEIIQNENIVKILCDLFQIENLEKAYLKEEAEEYLLSIGLTDEQLNALADKLIDKGGKL